MNKERDLRSWWWGRTLPIEHKDININNLSVQDIEILDQLRDIVFIAYNLGVELPFGNYVKRKDIYA